MKKELPQWLLDLQESSWELELLISGGAIFSLLQASDFFTENIVSLKITNALPGTDMFLIFGSFSIQVLTLGFILHLVLRSFWLALVCINYVYPQGVQQQQVRWKRPFRPGVHEGQDLYDTILKTDHLCGLVMYMSIISTFLLGGLMLVIFVLLTIPGGFLHLNERAGFPVYFQVFKYALVLYVLDLLLFGFLRRVPVLSYVVYPVFRLFDLLSLRFLYQRSLWLFNTNIRKPRFALFSGLFLVVAFFYSYGSVYRVLHWRNPFDQRDYRFQLAGNVALASGYYLDEHEGRKVTHVAIPSKTIEKDYLEVFVVYRKEYDWHLQYLGDSLYLSDMLLLSIDDSLYRTVQWFPHWKKDNDQLGITAMVPVQHLANGEHVLTVASAADTSRRQLIPFWKEDK